MSFFIRPSNPGDVNAILGLIKELAEYEKEPDAVKATPELLKKNIFDSPVAHAFIACAGSPEAPGEAIGLALYFFNFSTWTGKAGIYVGGTVPAWNSDPECEKLEDLYVKPEYRGAGVGKALFAELGKLAEEKDCARIDWSVLKWNKPSIDFYEKKLEAKAMDEWMGMRLEGEGIHRLATL